MSLRLVGAGAPEPAPPRPAPSRTLPLRLARHLRVGEALVFWGVKERVSLRPLVGVIALGLLVLAVVSAFFPGIWLQPWSDLWRPLAVLFAPSLVVVAREYASLRAVLVTDGAVIDVPRRGAADRLGFDAVRRVRRDLWTGGVRLEGARHAVKIPPSLAADVRAAISSQRAGMVRASPAVIDDPLGWMP